MSISVACECGKRLRVKENRAGEHVKCPACGRRVAVPGEPPAADPADAPLETESAPAETSPVRLTANEEEKVPDLAPASLAARSLLPYVAGTVAAFLVIAGSVLLLITLLKEGQAPVGDPETQLTADTKDKETTEPKQPEQLLIVPKSKEDSNPDIAPQPKAEPIPPPKPEVSAEPNPKPDPEPKPKPKPETDPKPKPKPKPETEAPAITKISDKTLEQWIKELNSPDPSVVENAIRMIVQFGKDAHEAVPTLIRMMSHPDVGISNNATMALRTIVTEKELETKAVMDALIKVLQGGPTVARLHAALALAQVGPKAKAAIKPLVEQTIKSVYSWELRKAAAYALGQIAFEISPILAVAPGKRTALQKEELAKYSKIGPPENVLRALSNLLYKDKESCAQVRLQAVLSIGNLQGHRTSAGAIIVRLPLEQAAKDTDSAVVIWAHVLQAQMEGAKPDVHVTFITNQLQKGADAQTRAHAAQSLGVLGLLAKGAVPNLIESLQDKEVLVAVAAAGALGQMKDQVQLTHINAIAKLLESKELPARCQAARALGLVGAKTKVPDLIDLLRDKEAEAATCAATSLILMKDDISKENLAAIAKMIMDKDSQTQSQAIQMIALLGTKAKDHIPDLINALKDDDVPVVVSALLALASMGKDAKQAIPDLAKLKQHKDETIKEAAARALDEIMDKPNK